MALDAVLGTGKAHLSANVTVTTTSAVATGSLIVYFGAGFVGGATMTPPGAGLTWTGVPSNPVTSGSLKLYCWYAQAPSGLAISTALTASSTGTPDLMACAIALSGRDTTAPLTGSNGRAASTAGWDGGAISTVATDDLIAVAFEDGSGTDTNSVTGSNVEWADFNDATQSEAMAGVYQLNVAGGSITAAGTWSVAASWVGIAASFAAAASSAASTMAPAFNAIPFMGGIPSG